VPQQSFAALRHRGYRAYFIGSALAMMADSIEHVISYWIIFQKFHSAGARRLRGAVALAAVPLLLGVLGRARRPLRPAAHHPARHAAVHGGLARLGVCCS